MSDQYLTKEEVKQWRSSVEKITLEDFAARLGKKIKEEKETHDLVDILAQQSGEKSFNVYDEEADLKYFQRPEKIDIVVKSEKSVKDMRKRTQIDIDEDDLEDDTQFDDDDLQLEIEPKVKETAKKIIKEPVKKAETVEVVEVVEPVVEKAEKVSKKKEKPEKTEKVAKAEKTAKEPAKKAVKEEKPAKAEKATKTAEKTADSDTSVTFRKPLTDREEKVFEYFKSNKGKIVFAKDIADLLELKRDYIYKYIKNLRAKIVEDIISNAENGGFLLK